MKISAVLCVSLILSASTLATLPVTLFQIYWPAPERHLWEKTDIHQTLCRSCGLSESPGLGTIIEIAFFTPVSGLMFIQAGMPDVIFHDNILYLQP